MSGEDTTDRPRGVLTKDDREFLLGRKEYEHPQTAKNTRRRIRERIINSIRDFSLIAHNLSEEDRGLIFGDADGTSKKSSSDLPGIWAGLSSIIALLYQELPATSKFSFKNLIVEGVNEAEIDKGQRADIELDIDVYPLDTEKVKEELKEAEELPVQILAELLIREDATPDEIQEYIEERVRANQEENNRRNEE